MPIQLGIVKIINMVKKEKVTLYLFFFLLLLSSCTGKIKQNAKRQQTVESLKTMLRTRALSTETRYAIINQIAKTLLVDGNFNNQVLFLTSWVEKHPDDPYNAYWLLMTANAYLENGATPIARYYFERIIRNYPDLVVQGKSVHFLCLQNLIKISTTSANRITYFNQLISQFPNNVNITELYYRLALEYEKEGNWTQALRTYALFLNRDDAQSIQIQGIPNAYITAKQLTDFAASSKDWTFATLDELVAAVKNAIVNYNWKALDRYRSKVNFFAMSWQQDATDENSQSSFSMGNYMRRKIHFENDLDESSTPTDAYLRTWGWSSYVNVWYLYFRKVNFPADMKAHGRWEWAGIYYGEKL